MALKVYNTLTRKKEEFHPITPGRVKMYVCGITAYDSCHLGHARAAICFDVIVRYLRSGGYSVTYVRNYTDVDDKIINRSNKEGRSCAEITEQYIEEYRRDMASLQNLPPDIEPKATEHVSDMIRTIQKLIVNGLAYVRDGSVFFSVRKFAGYGRLSGKNIDELEAGARVDINEAKDDPLDFALWKASKPNEPKWPSPWGEGRPGWHIECSSMSSKYLGQPFDIHGGGRDLVFPHHENEIAQAEGAEKKPFARYWLHNGFININAEKMSKSLGNFMTISDVVKKHGAEAVRFFIISNHYRSPIDYTEKAMAEASATLDRFYETAGRVEAYAEPPHRTPGKVNPKTSAEKEIFDALGNAGRSLSDFMDDDFNTAGAIGAVFEIVRVLNRYLDTKPEKEGEFFRWVVHKWREARSGWQAIFGFFGTSADGYFEGKKERLGGTGVAPSVIDALIAERSAARGSKDFARADEIRRKLDDMGIAIKDMPDGSTTWQVK